MSSVNPPLLSLQEETGTLMSHCDGILQIFVRLEGEILWFIDDLYACDFPSF